MPLTDSLGTARDFVDRQWPAFIGGMIVGGFLALHFLGVNHSCCGLAQFVLGEIWGYL